MEHNLEDNILIRDRYSLYSDSVFQSNKDRWLECWHEDGTWKVFGKAIKGKFALCAQWDATWAAIEKMAFFSEIGAMEIQGNSASVRSYCHEIVSFKNGNLLKVIAQYDDELIKEHERWLFMKRDYHVLIKQ